MKKECYLMKYDIWGNQWRSYLVEFPNGDVMYLDLVLNSKLLQLNEGNNLIPAVV